MPRRCRRIQGRTSSRWCATKRFLRRHHRRGAEKRLRQWCLHPVRRPSIARCWTVSSSTDSSRRIFRRSSELFNVLYMSPRQSRQLKVRLGGFFAHIEAQRAQQGDGSLRVARRNRLTKQLRLLRLQLLSEAHPDKVERRPVFKREPCFELPSRLLGALRKLRRKESKMLGGASQMVRRIRTKCPR